jgi:3-phenylpropionate/cinnamic acid dioxygenase small subunit
VSVHLSRKLLLHYECEQWLTHEALLLDENRYEEWFALLAPEVAYAVPIRTVIEGSSRPSFSERAFHFKEDRASIRARIDRLNTGLAWAERPPTRTHRFVSNVIVEHSSDSAGIAVQSSLLLYLGTGDQTQPEILTARRRDRLVRVDDQWKLESRWAYIGQTILSSSLSVFL